MKNARDISQALRKSGKLRIDLTSGGVEGIQVGNRRFSREEADRFFIGTYGTKPKSPSSYYDFIETTIKGNEIPRNKYRMNKSYVV